MKDSSKNRSLDKLKRIPLGIISGASGIISFFSTIGIIVAYVVSAGIAAQTNKTATIFDTWWQTLLFVVALLSAFVAISTLVLYCLKSVKESKNDTSGKQKSIFSCSVWTMLTIFFSLFSVFLGVGSSIAKDNEAPINKTLGVDPYVKVQTGEGVGEKAERYSSNFIERNADGTPIYQTDSSGNKSTIKNNKTMRENSKKVSEQVAVEGTVLLWNNNDALPLQTNEKVSLFGIASAKGKYAVSGYGSGEIKADPTEEKLANALKSRGLDVNEKLDQRYEYFTDETIKKGNFSYGLHAGRWPNSNYKPVYCVNEVPWGEVESVVDETITSYDTAVYVISRRAGEDQDIIDNVENNETDVDGGMNHLELTKDEAEILTNLAEKKAQGKVKKIILLLNTANPLQCKEIVNNKYAIDACVWTGLGGSESLVQVADALSNSNYVMSGHTPDTLLMDNHLAPSNANFGDFTWTNDDVKEKLKDIPYLNDEYKYYYQTHNLKYIVYQEGIYVGYKYFETRYEDYVLDRYNANGNNGSFDGASWNYKNEVAFPFGYGLSYTEFERSNPTFSESEDKDKYTVTLDIKNIGDKYAGKDTLQVYLSKPYTTYDQEHGVEKSAIELVDFAKTDILEVNSESQTLKVEISKENLRTYDSYGKQTYILEKGDYYLSIGTDAHDALNNVLAAKGYNPENTNNRMDSDGDANMAYKITINEDDFITYSKAENGEDITNRFNDADLNLYKGTKDDQNITYLSRKDWQGTYPLSEVKLECKNETMVYDMQYGHEVVANENDKMPLYETVTSSAGALNLAMMEELSYDNPLWEDLLNQMSYKEQVIMMNYGMGFLAGAESIGAPGLKATDGPQGIYITKYAFPSPMLSAASFNKGLVNELGDAYAHEALHSGYSLVYAPGGNIHRSLYSGRNFEYYSEDALLGGKMLASQVEGMMNRGIIVCSKHFAFNDQETNRYGVATFFNEQSARETYLKVFEIGVREGGMNGLMSAFNRIGTTWTGRHKGLLTDVLRKEWGFVGIVETDACSGSAITPHMEDKWAVAEGLVAGNDVWMSRGSDTMLDDSKTNPTVMLALREACHRVLYTQLHSAAINGITVNTKMVKITPWWQSTLNLLIAMSIVALSLSLIMATLSFLFKSKKAFVHEGNNNGDNKNTIANHSSNGNSDSTTNSANNQPDNHGKKPKKKSKWSTKKTNLITAGILGFTFIISTITFSSIFFGEDPALKGYVGNGEVHTCTHHCPVCGNCVDMTCDKPACATKCKCTTITIEAESEYVEKIDGKAIWGGMHTERDEERDLSYVAGLDGNSGAKLNFKFFANQKGRVLLNATIRRRPWNFDIDDFVNVYANNEKLDYEVTLPGTVENADYLTDDGTDGKGDFYSFDIRNFEIQEGLNIITFEVTEKSGGQCPNFDKITLISNSVISEYQHLCNSKCPICGKCTNQECDDQYVCKDKCACNSITIEAESDYVERKTNDGEALSIGTDETTGTKFIKDLNDKANASINFKVEAKEKGNAMLSATFRSMPWTFELPKYVGVKVNGQEYEYDKRLPKDPDETHDVPSKCDFVAVEIGIIELKTGLNDITFFVKDNSYPQCPDFDKISLLGAIDISEITHNCESKCPLCGKCLDKDCTNIVCEEKCECKNTTIEAESEYVKRQTKDGEALNIATDEEKNITYVKDLNGNGGASLSFVFNSDSDATAILSLTLRALPWTFELPKYAGIQINNQEYEYNKWLPKDPDETHTTPNECDFVTIAIGEIDLVSGANIVKVSVKEVDYPQCPDFDKITITSSATISEYTHVCEHVCKECGKCQDLECLDPINCKDKCECKISVFEAESNNVTISQAADPKYGGISRGTYESTNTGYIKVENDNAGSSFTFNINSDQDIDVSLYAYVTPRKYVDYALNDDFDLIVNGDTVTYTSEKVLKDESLEDNHWAEYFVGIKIAKIHLNQGDNTITFQSKGWQGLMMDKIELYGNANITEKSL